MFIGASSGWVNCGAGSTGIGATDVGTDIGIGVSNETIGSGGARGAVATGVVGVGVAGGNEGEAGIAIESPRTS